MNERSWAEEHINKAVALLRGGELVAFPTETVYGLGADARNVLAVEKIFHAKGRPSHHPLIVHLADKNALNDWAAEIPPCALQLATALWPGPLTIVLPRHSQVPKVVTGGQDTIAVRVPNHPLALTLLRQFSGGLAAPSANPFGAVSPTTAAHVRDGLGSKVALILDGGPCQVGIESTIVDLTSSTPLLLRPGAITAATLEQLLQRPVRQQGEGAVPRVPGALPSHYSPRTPVSIMSREEMRQVWQRNDRDSDSKNFYYLLLAPLAQSESGFAPAHLHILGVSAEKYAHNLYAALHRADGSGCRRIIVERPPSTEEWVAIHDRLERSSAKPA